MKHRQTDIGQIGPVNTGGHAIGLDIGATSVRATVLAPGTVDGRPSVTIHGIGDIALPAGAVVNGVVTDPAALTRALKQLWNDQKFRHDHVILGVANPQVVVRAMQIPNLPPDQRAKALPFQARDVVALPIDQVILDFVALGPNDADANMIDGLLVATPREPVLAAVAAVERAGLHVARVDLSAFAALRSIAEGQLAVEAVIDLGAHLSTIVIHDRGVPRLVRSLARGGQELTERVADRLSLSGDDAERAKFEVGLTGSQAAVSAVLNEAVRPLLAEIRSSINYFRSGNNGAQVERISLTGGASGLPGLSDALANQNAIPTHVVAPTRHIRNLRASPYGARMEGSASAVSVGLAMVAA